MVGLGLQLAGYSCCNDGLSKSLGCWDRDVAFLVSRDFKCLALTKGLDYRNGKSISSHSHFSGFNWPFGLDFELVHKKWSI